ncbi:MAG: gamma carbonic anhydrase family protein [Acidobacteria bacterium]|nr:MAG: gamma carbonic anhydrase family protein [Acidobacteriota bacterium]REK06354.1 MAG: gamma carbonic anhydrase family protein [Acidobacteriota bacterium]
MEQTPNRAAAWIAPSAELYGEIHLGEGVSIWPRVVMRAEAQSIRIGRFTNVQDFVMVHIGFDQPTRIGDYCSITHHATVHGATIEDECLIGINATLMDGVVIGAGSIVAGHTIVTEGTVVPPGSVVAGVPGKVIASRDNRLANRLNAVAYHQNAIAYAAGNHRRWAEPEFQSLMARARAEGLAEEAISGAKSRSGSGSDS